MIEVSVELIASCDRCDKTFTTTSYSVDKVIEDNFDDRGWYHSEEKDLCHQCYLSHLNGETKWLRNLLKSG